MKKAILYVNRSEEPALKKQLPPERFEYTDKETLIKIINCVLEDNRILRQYIEMLERRNPVNY